MPPLTLPLTFHNSFWSQNYRTGLEVLFKQLEQGCAENDEIVAFLKARIRAEASLGSALTHPELTATGGSYGSSSSSQNFYCIDHPPKATGFGADDGASLYMAFRGLQHESVAIGEAHRAIAKDLQDTVAEPFEGWAYQHAMRIEANKKDMLEGWVSGYETEIADVEMSRALYLEKCRKADDAEDDVKFAPNQDLQDGEKFTQQSVPGGGAPEKTVRRSASVADRLAERLRSVSQRSREPSPTPRPFMAEPKSTLQMLADGPDDGASDGTVTPKLDKGKSKGAEHMSPQAMSPIGAPELGITIPAAPSVTVTTHIVLGGVTFGASEVSALLFKAQSEMAVRNVRVTLFGEYEHCFSGEEFVVWLKMNVEGFKGSLDLAEEAARTLTDDYQALRRIGELGNKFDNSPNVFYQFRPKAFNLQASLQRATTQDDAVLISPVGSTFSDSVAEGVKRSNTVFSSIVKAVQTARTGDPNTELPHVKARRAADEADATYRKAARSLDQHRCALEERIEETLKALQRWEMDRLNAIKTVLLQYQGITSSLSGPISAINDRSSVLISSFMPENDVKALIERYRTGPFRPDPKIYESITHEMDSSFGIDLRKWAGEGAFQQIRSIGSVDDMHSEIARADLPPVLTALLEALQSAYSKLPSDDQRRKTWIYEVPLASVHHLRATLNTLPLDMPVSQDLFVKCDTPVLASTVKLWLLELNPPVGQWDGWEEIKKIYRSVGADIDLEGVKEKRHIEELKSILVKLPVIHLKVLDAILTHLKTHHEDILPPVLEQKKRETAQRAVPVRKRTKLVDARQMRKSIDATADPKKYLEAQFALKNMHSTPRPQSPSPTANSQGTGRPPAFLSPPSSPPAAQAGGLPNIDTGITGEAKRASPVDLNEKSPQGTLPATEAPPAITSETATEDEQTTEDEPFVPPGSAAPAPSVSSPQIHAPSPVAASPSDTVLATGPGSLSRKVSNEQSRIRGPRVPAARGPRPLSTASAATVPVAGRASPTRGMASPRTSFTAARSGSPGTDARNTRPRTPPDVKDYLPSKKGGKTAAGSFSRTKPMGDSSPGDSQ
ncbi:hypothetical protein FRB96_002894 [Tulasnella sp. 330]|nr:hypothetical protein FRB96_002894 [Tulasnella sp. 330]KAG8884947.1 hypothetical protein FRB97_002775 [Tulasnella sp. 331]